MKFLAFLALTFSVVHAGPIFVKRATVNGIDVSSDQPNVSWDQVKAKGVNFVYIKATEGIGMHQLGTLMYRYSHQ